MTRDVPAIYHCSTVHCAYFIIIIIIITFTEYTILALLFDDFCDSLVIWISHVFSKNYRKEKKYSNRW